MVAKVSNRLVLLNADKDTSVRNTIDCSFNNYGRDPKVGTYRPKSIAELQMISSQSSARRKIIFEPSLAETVASIKVSQLGAILSS